LCGAPKRNGNRGKNTGPIPGPTVGQAPDPAQTNKGGKKSYPGGGRFQLLIFVRRGGDINQTRPFGGKGEGQGKMQRGERGRSA